MAQLVAGRYAGALFELSLEKNIMDVCLNKLLGIEELSKDAEFAIVMKHPWVSAEEKTDLVLKALGEDIPDELKGFIGVLASNNRLGMLNNVVTEFESLVQSYKSIMPAFIYSAEALSEVQLEKIKAQLEKKHNKSVKIEAFVDPSIIGGLKIRTEDTLVDTSVKKDIEDIKSSLLGKWRHA